MRRPLSAALGALAPVALLGVALVGAPAASAATTCTPSAGTLVGVDFGHWTVNGSPGPVVVGCGLKQSTGNDLLHAAGFTTLGTHSDGPAFICRLGNAAFDQGTQFPTPATDKCVVTPPASAYWSFWTALKGVTTWTHSPLGAMADVPKPGEVELWTFGGTDASGSTGSGVPRYSPSYVRSHLPGSTPTPSPTATKSAPRPTTAAAGPVSSTAAAGVSPASRPGSSVTSGSVTDRPTAAPTSRAPASVPGRTTAARTPSSAASAAGSATSAGSTPTIVQAQPAADVSTSSGTPWPLIVGLCLVALLGAASVWSVWHRRHLE